VLYEQPVNLFVAGFIGSPPMNFLPATVHGDKVELPFVTVDLPEHIRGKVPEDKLLIAGIRPEYFADASVVDPEKLAKGATFRTTIDVVEWLGNEAYAYIPYEAPTEVASQLAELERELDSEALRTQLIVSLESASRVKDGEEADVFVDVRKMHLFDPASGENLTRRTAD
jgi:multiple sugar transport system ATP-binding protein